MPSRLARVALRLVVTVVTAVLGRLVAAALLGQSSTWARGAAVRWALGFDARMPIGAAFTAVRTLVIGV